MFGISDQVAKEFGLGDDKWQEMSFTLVNPTNTDVVIDLFNPQVANTINIPSRPSPSLTLPPITYTLIQSPPLSSPIVQNICIAHGNGKIWVGDGSGGSGNVQSINESTNTVNTINLPAQVDAINVISGVAYSATSNKVIYGGSALNVVTILDATTETILANTVLGIPVVGVSSIIWNSVKNTWYIARINNSINEVDCVTNALVGTIVLPPTATPKQIAFDAVTNKIYVTDDSSVFGLDSNEIFEIDCVTNTVLSVISTAGIINRPVGIAFKYISGNPTLFIGSSFNAGIYSYDINTTISTTISLTGYAFSLIVHPTSNSVYAGAWLGGSNGQVLVIDTLTNTVTNNISFVQTQNIVNFAYSPTTNNIYISTFQPIQGQNTLLPPTGFYISTKNERITISQVVRDGFYSPYWIRRLYFYSNNTSNFNQNFFLLTKDANGNLCEVPQVPNLSVATVQFQAGIGLVDYPNKEFILGINQWYKEIKVVANSDLTMILVYQQIQKSNLLSYIDKVGKGVNSTTYDGLANVEIQKFNLNQLDYIMPANALVLPKDTITPVNVQEINSTISKSLTNSSNETS
jgi:DNA-binding beta-propeller fold protein YncE